MKSLSDYQAELETIETALQEARTTANQRGTIGYQLQVTQTKMLLGQADKSALQDVQTQLDKAVEALTRIPMLEQAVADAKSMVENAKHQERHQYVKGITDEYEAAYAQYVANSKAVLASFRDLQRLDNLYRSLAKAGALPHLLDPYQRELNLPAVTGPLSTRSGFTTGQE